ncbi:hypothetical protein PHYBOEH_008143 [Phytophthora boehmeriae]|uniref:Necrosis inducing-like protein NPP1 type n=1 Tax=Phytophthora boehmeriae TaxID=109152 RepID=A0A8T1W6E2_9STRA|nr:hypothetical protein PHYBOEH_008143 [Phytophthora boehmeriae]
MNPLLFAGGAVALFLSSAVSINHDLVKPFAQPEPATDLEEVGVMFKPQLDVHGVCHPFPAVNAAGETSGGLKPRGGDSGCEEAPLGSQIYGRATQFEDKWAIMYAWYFPTGWAGDFPTRRHDWSNVVVWIDDPGLTTPSILGLSMQVSDSRYEKETSLSKDVLNGTTPKIYIMHSILLGDAVIGTAVMSGESQDLIMWEQLTEEARTATTSAGLMCRSLTITSTTDSKMRGRFKCEA